MATRRRAKRTRTKRTRKDYESDLNRLEVEVAEYYRYFTSTSNPQTQDTNTAMRNALRKFAQTGSDTDVKGIFEKRLDKVVEGTASQSFKDELYTELKSRLSDEANRAEGKEVPFKDIEYDLAQGKQIKITDTKELDAVFNIQKAMRAGRTTPTARKSDFEKQTPTYLISALSEHSDKELQHRVSSGQIGERQADWAKTYRALEDVYEQTGSVSFKPTKGKATAFADPDDVYDAAETVLHRKFKR